MAPTTPTGSFTTRLLPSWVSYSVVSASYTPGACVSEPVVPTPEVIQLDPLILAPPAPNEPTFIDFIWRWRAAQPGSVRKRTGKPWTDAQRRRFKREAEALMAECSPEEAALRWDAVTRPVGEKRLGRAARLTSSQAAGLPVVQHQAFL